MFCAKCGQSLEEGKRFCISCGAPVTAPPTPPGFPPGPLPGPPPAGNHTGLIVGSIVAGIIVLAGLGVGLWLGLRDDGKTDSTTVVSGTTSSFAGTGGSVTTGGGTAPSSGGAITTQTIPSLTGSTGPPGVTGSTSTTADLLAEWYTFHDNLVLELDYDNGRIPELADAINATTPDVPDWVYEELSDMADSLGAASQTMADTTVPPGFDDAHFWIMEAAAHMGNRIQATMDGISLIWSTGSINSAKASFDIGRAERDAYVDALGEHYSFMPAD